MTKLARKVGFTGTHHGMDEVQKRELEEKLKQLFDDGFNEFHFGLCIGADEQAAVIAKMLGFRVVAHPGLASNPTNLMYRSDWIGSDEVRDPKPFIGRDHDIVDETEEMVATPVSEDEEVRSGTWTTVRYARTQDRKVTVLNPKKTPKFDPHAMPVKTNVVAGEIVPFGPTHRQRGIR
jgi:hypothetical protein